MQDTSSSLTPFNPVSRAFMSFLSPASGEKPVPHDPVWAVLHGSHAFGFESDGSDYDVYGVYVTPLDTVIGLHDVFAQSYKVTGTLEVGTRDLGQTKMEYLGRDIGSFLRLLMSCNGSMLELAHSDLLLVDTPTHLVNRQISWGRELRDLALRTICLRYGSFYGHVAEREWITYVQKRQLWTPKPLLHTFRMLLTGCWLMRTSSVKVDIRQLIRLEPCDTSMITDWIQAKASGSERVDFSQDHHALITRYYHELRGRLEGLIAMNSNSLPDDIPENTWGRANGLLIGARTRTRDLTWIQDDP